MWIADQCEDIEFGVYSPGAQAFGRTWGRAPQTGPRKVQDWISCREELHNENRRLARFYYAHDLPKPSRGRAISVFMDKVEDRLNLATEDRTRMGPTSKRRVCWIEVSEWWRGHSLRRSLFTALLRAASSYRIEQDNFDHCLVNGNYLEDTQEALNRFLDGYTYYWGNRCGWVNAFGSTEWGFKPVNIEVALRKEPRPRTIPVPKKTAKSREALVGGDEVLF